MGQEGVWGHKGPWAPLGVCEPQSWSGIGTLGDRCRTGFQAGLANGSKGSPGSEVTIAVAIGVLEVCKYKCGSVCSSVTLNFGGLPPGSQWALLGIMEKPGLPPFPNFSLHRCSKRLGLPFLGGPPRVWVPPAVNTSEWFWGTASHFCIQGELQVTVGGGRRRSLTYDPSFPQPSPLLSDLF